MCIAGYCLNVGLKLLGNTLSHDLTWKRHVDNSVKKAGKIIYILYQIKRTGVNQADLGRSIHKCRETGCMLASCSTLTCRFASYELISYLIVSILRMSKVCAREDEN